MGERHSHREKSTMKVTKRIFVTFAVLTRGAHAQMLAP
jgi:hypothetical protein